mgnify:CR=1 FL=1
MRHILKLSALTALLSLFSVTASAYDIAVENEGVTIYYNYTADGTELEVTFKDTSDRGYSGIVVIPEQVTYNGKTYNVTSIGHEAFSGCSGLTSVTIPNSVTSIGDYAFNGCSGLTTVNFNADSCTRMGSSWSSVFYGCTNLTTLNIGSNVKTIPDYAFAGCSGLTSLTIPNSVTSIGNYAFGECRGLTTVNFNADSCTTMGSRTYNGCTNLTTLNIGRNVKSIPDSAFARCSSLTGTLTIPDSVTSIGTWAFANCSGLTSVTIPNSVTTIGNCAFLRCSGLTGTLTIPSSVTTIGDWAFQNCTSLSRISFPSTGRLAINRYAFSLCPGLTGALTIPNSVTSIGPYAFWQCTSLTSVTIPNSITTINTAAFWQCTSLTSVTIPNSITTIDTSAFQECSGLTSVIIPNSVTTIGNYAFLRCSSLSSVTIPSSVTTIGDWAFQNCTSLSSISFPSTGRLAINRYAFSLCPGLTGTLTIPNSVTSIGPAAFWQCTGLTSVTIPNSITTIDTAAFKECSGLTSVTIPNSVTTIGNQAFLRCSSLTSVTIPNSVTSIGNNAFARCGGLTTITIPNSITSIGDTAFYKCIGMQSLTFEGITPPTFGNNVFDSVPATIPVQVPCGRTAVYSVRLTMFSNFVETQNTFRAVSADSTQGVVQVLNAPTCSNPNAVLYAVPSNGYRFLRWSTGSTANPYTLTVSSDTTITAFFTPDGTPQPTQYTLTVVSANPTMGSVSGGGTYDENTTATLAAIPNSGYRFLRWQDNNTDNPRSVTVTTNATYTAYFESDAAPQPTQYTLTVVSADPSMGSVMGGGSYAENATATLAAIPNTGYRFLRWQDNNTDNPRTVTVTTNAIYIAYFESDGTPQPTQFTLTAVSADPTMGSVVGGGTYAENTTATLAAIPNSGYRFLRWQDNNTDNPRSVTVTTNATYTAYFESTTGIGDVEGGTACVAVSGRHIAVRGAAGQPVAVYDATGRCLASRQDGSEFTFEAPAAGIYLVRIGATAAQRVAVVR